MKFLVLFLAGSLLWLEWSWSAEQSTAKLARYPQIKNESQSDLFRKKTFGVGVEIGPSILEYTDSDVAGSQDPSTRFGLQGTYRATPWLGLGVGFRYAKFANQVPILEGALQYSQSFSVMDLGTQVLFYPRENGFYFGSHLGLEWIQYQWEEELLIPAYESQGRRLVIGPVVGYDYLFSPSGISIGGRAGVIYHPATILDDRYEGALVQLPSYLTFDLALVAQFWLK